MVHAARHRGWGFGVGRLLCTREGDRHAQVGSQLKQGTVDRKHLCMKGLLPLACQRNGLRLLGTREVTTYKC